MKKIYIYALACALTAISCQDNEWVTDSTTPQVPEIEIPMGAADGELLIKFVPEMSDILDQTLTRAGGISTRSGIPSTDEVLNILGAYHFERVFPKQKNVPAKQVCTCGISFALTKTPT